MRVFKRKRRGADGKVKADATWSIELRDHLEIVRRLPGFKDKAATEELGRKAERLIALRLAGESPDTALTRWLEYAPGDVRDKLAQWGIIEAARHAAGRTLEGLLEDWRADLTARGNVTRYVNGAVQHVTALVKRCGFTHLSDVSASRVHIALAEMRAENMGARTRNSYLSDAKAFFRWLQRNGLTSDNPLAHLQGTNEATDIRHERRALTHDEVARLVAAAQSGSIAQGMAGDERAMLYCLALGTGLRANELRSLTKASFNLDAETPTVTVKAAYSKNRKESVLPLRRDLAEAMRNCLTEKLPTAPVFALPPSDRTAKMFRHDLEVAGITYRDDAGRVADFHALRHTFISNLAKGGVHPKTAQSLARHSTITLTMDRYSHVALQDEACAIEKLPSVLPLRVAALATGTYGACPEDTQKQGPSQGPFFHKNRGHSGEHQGKNRHEISTQRIGLDSLKKANQGPFVAEGKVVGSSGVEPEKAEPKSAVLPITPRPIHKERALTGIRHARKPVNWKVTPRPCSSPSHLHPVFMLSPCHD